MICLISEALENFVPLPYPSAQPALGEPPDGLHQWKAHGRTAQKWKMGLCTHADTQGKLLSIMLVNYTL